MKKEHLYIEDTQCVRCNQVAPCVFLLAEVKHPIHGEAVPFCPMCLQRLGGNI